MEAATGCNRPMWFLAGLLVGIGVVGLLTGLPLALIGLVLAVRNAKGGRRGAWWMVVGLGAGAALLTFDDVRKFDNDRCIGQAGRGFECPAAWAHEIFWTGVVLIALGLIGAAATRLFPSKHTNPPAEPPPLSSRND